MDIAICRKISITIMRLCLSISFTLLLCFYLPYRLNNNTVQAISYQQESEILVSLPETKKVIKTVERTDMSLGIKRNLTNIDTPLLLPVNFTEIQLTLPEMVAPRIDVDGLPKINSFVVGIEEVDQPPELIKFVQPKMPVAGRKYKEGGKVLLRLVIEANGLVSNAKVLDSTPKNIFDNAALLAVNKWRFKPAVLSGKAVKVFVDVPISFKVN